MTMYRPHRLCRKENKPKEPSLYRSLCISILSMFLSTVMLVGTTMAWFSDSLQTGVYTITSANFSTTVYYCTELSNAENIPNNWQRLNPSNTTMFGGGSLSSDSYQTAYLKIVNASNIDLKYTLSITGESTESSTPPLSLAFEKVADEVDLNTAFTSLDEASTQSGENTTTGTEISFDVPGETITFVALKLSLNGTASVSGSDSTDNAQEAPKYKFGLHLAITQTVEGAEVNEPDSSPTMGVDMDIIGDTTPTSAPNNTSDNGDDQSDEGTTSGSSDTPSSDTPSGSTTETENTTGTSESGTPDTSGGSGDTTVTENGSET